MSGLIRTVGGDLAADLAGPTYAHEHLIIDSPLVAETMPHIHLPSVDEAAAEVRTCISAGVRTMVDAMPAAAGRDPERLSRVSILTGMRVVAATGLHTERYYEDVPWAGTEGPDDLAARFIADIDEGIDRHDYRGDVVDRTEVRAGIIKVASTAETFDDRDLRLFEAAAIAGGRTGAPILTHTEGGRGGLSQIDMLLDLDVPPERVAISHTDKVADTSYHLDMLASGVYLCYDQGLRDLEATVRLAASAIESDFVDRILLGTDGARRSLWSTLDGAPGLASLYHSVSEVFEPEVVERLFVTNPARYLTLCE